MFQYCKCVPFMCVCVCVCIGSVDVVLVTLGAGSVVPAERVGEGERRGD